MIESLSIWDWSLAVFASFLLGVSKSGLKGIGVIIVTIFALVFGGKVSTGIIAPLLLVGDVFAIIYYRRHVQWHYLFKLLPWMIIGVLIGVVVGKDLPEYIFKKGMAVLIFISVLIMFWWDYKHVKQVPSNYFFGASMGLLSGIATMIGNLAGAFANIYFLALRLPKNHFIGTAAWLFFIVNLFKIPFHVFYWKTINFSTLQINLLIVPALIIGLFTGIVLVSKIKDMNFRRIILILTAVGTLFIFFR
ncbi:sulfite exporter TauE/SafE family protein [Abyssalbus ytuae]|uniref:Probable membrane transporter protein n=1 Tax=Abyssalbus ytuae TaxID=2926907 RepID=A0A9E6ZKV0_9FLAO|nr:sulfite exporter TauE/SafE family protein [Abyssalbus ytuae]UOB17612.1 sulfite exporter TauE/SafE family protein [Abyssalbus ytuae]